MDVGRESGIVLCCALGLDPNLVRSIAIHWQAGEMPYAAVELFLNEHAVYEVIQLGPRQVPHREDHDGPPQDHVDDEEGEH